MKRIFSLIALALCITILGSSPAVAYTNISPADAYASAAGDPNVYILDVRTEAEWRWVGHPGKDKLGLGAELAGKVVNIAWSIDYKGGTVVNPSFITDINQIFGSNPDVVLITMCRSGVRSVAAAEALEAAGYLNVQNMLTGFEGGTDATGYRTRNGWKVDGLPYNFSSTGSYQD